MRLNINQRRDLQLIGWIMAATWPFVFVAGLIVGVLLQ
jgi:hypothetical protein